MATLTNEQIEQKKKQLKQLAEEINAIAKELEEAGAWPLSDDDLNDVAGGMPVRKPTGGVPGDDPLDPSKPGQKPKKDGIYY